MQIKEIEELMESRMKHGRSLIALRIEDIQDLFEVVKAARELMCQNPSEDAWLRLKKSLNGIEKWG